MRVAWSSAALRHACMSRDGFVRVAPSQAEAARLLLALVSAADNLTQLASLSCVDVSPLDTGVLLRMGDVELDCQLVPSSAPARDGTISQIDRRSGLLIRTVRIAGNPLLKAAG